MSVAGEFLFPNYGSRAWDRAADHPKLAFVGAFSGTHIGKSLIDAARAMKTEAIGFDTTMAQEGSRVLRTLSRRLRDRQPPRLQRFWRAVVACCEVERPGVLISTGVAPLTDHAIGELKGRGIVCANYSTDDPWNPRARANWYLRALPLYDVVFTPRRSTIADLHALGCKNVHRLTFAYDPKLFPEKDDDQWEGPRPQVLFVGGADADRVEFFRRYGTIGGPVSLVGGYWNRYRDMRPFWLGHQSPIEVSALTRAASVNLILVRRANRDGHVMRSFEAGAIGGCLAVEDTEDHREIFGPDGETVRYFRTPLEAAALCSALGADARERARLAAAVKARIRGGCNTYADRLESMLAVVRDIGHGQAARLTHARVTNG